MTDNQVIAARLGGALGLVVFCIPTARGSLTVGGAISALFAILGAYGCTAPWLRGADEPEG